MAEKILQTRIINKHADLAAWKDSSLPLKTGEIALARVETTKPDGNGGFYKVPTYLMKVGDDNKTFSQLEWLAAPASDVHEWAKASVKPSYIASEIARGTSTVAADLQTVEQDVATLKAAVGEGGSVADAIKAAIEALDVEDTAVANQFVTAVAETDGKISVSRRALEAADIPALGIDKITGLQDALDAKALETSVAQRFTAVDDKIGTSADAAGTATVYGAIATAKKAGDDAQADLNSYRTSNNAALAEVKATAEAATTVDEATSIANTAVSTFKTQHFDGLATRVGTAEQNIVNNATAVSNLAGDGRTTETVKGNADAIADLEARIGSVANVMNFRGVSTGTNPGDGITDPQNGDVIIFGEAEYVYSVVDGTGSWVKFGDASDNATAISDLQTRVGTVETRLNTGDISQAIQANATAASDAQDAADAAQASADAIYKVTDGTASGFLADEIDRATKAEAALLGADGDASSANTIFGAKKYADEKAAAAETAANGYTDGKILTVNNTISALQTTVGENKTAAENATKNVADDLAAYISTNNAAVEAAATKGQQGIDDAADALAYAKDFETKKVDENTKAIAANAADIDAIEANFAKVKTVDGVSTLVVGAAEDVIIFDCGGIA